MALKRKKKKSLFLWIIFKLIKWVVLSSLILISVASIGIAGALYYYSFDLPPVSSLKEEYRPPQTTQIFTKDGKLIGELFYERRTVIPFERIPKVMIDAVLAAEDINFYHHKGFDILGIIRALFINVKEGRVVQGASTITQQVARTFFLNRQKSLERKIKELLLARRLEENLSKNEILFLYLNQINFGHGRYGVEEASQFYFGKHVWELTLPEAALLAGLPKGPSIYSPRINPEAAKKRRDHIIALMKKHKLITEEEAERAISTPIRIVETRSSIEAIAPEIVPIVKDYIINRFGEEEFTLGGYKVYTTIDSKYQLYAREALREGLKEIDRRHGYNKPYPKGKKRNIYNMEYEPLPLHEKVESGKYYVGIVKELIDEDGKVILSVGSKDCEINLKEEKRYNPGGLLPSQYFSRGDHVPVIFMQEKTKNICKLERGPQGALISIEVGSGNVVSMVGGYDVTPFGFNRVVHARRQPGSAFKPFVYGYAFITRKFTPATVITDAPEVLDGWIPQNSEPWNFSGQIRLREALAKSINIVAVKLILALGPENIVQFVKKFGIKSELKPTPSLALGAYEMTPLEITAAYSVFANGGIYYKPQFIERIIDWKGREVTVYREPPHRVIEEAEAYIITSVLKSVIERGTGSKANILKRPLAGKTGTSNEQKDAWFIGYSPQLVTGVWVGFDSFRSLGKNEYGSNAALPIWIRFMREALKDKPPIDFKMPEKGIEGPILIDPETGLLAYEGQENSIPEIFLEGTVPVEKATPPGILAPDQLLIQEYSSDSEDNKDTRE